MIQVLFALLVGPVFAARDSVAVFHRPEKVVVLINESGAASRLQQLLKAFGPELDLLWENADQSIRFNCGRNEKAATCTIRLLPSASVLVEPKKVAGWASGVAARDLELSWESSRFNRFTVKIENGNLTVHGQKP